LIDGAKKRASSLQLFVLGCFGRGGSIINTVAFVWHFKEYTLIFVIEHYPVLKKCLIFGKDNIQEKLSTYFCA